MPDIIRFKCSFCAASIKAPENQAGTKSRCPRCKQVVQVPIPERLLASNALPEIVIEEGPPAISRPVHADLTERPIRFACPTCRATLEVPGEKAGRKGRCVKCGQRVQVPNLDETVSGERLPDDFPLLPPQVVAPMFSPPLPELLVPTAIPANVSCKDWASAPPEVPEESLASNASESMTSEPTYSRPPSYYQGRGSGFGEILIWGGLGALFMALLGLLSSQYFPVFGGILEKGIATPWSPARLTLIPVHLFAFSIVGAFFGGVIGYLGKGSDLSIAIPWVMALVILLGIAVALLFILQKGGIATPMSPVRPTPPVRPTLRDINQVPSRLPEKQAVNGMEAVVVGRVASAGANVDVLLESGGVGMPLRPETIQNYFCIALDTGNGELTLCWFHQDDVVNGARDGRKAMIRGTRSGDALVRCKLVKWD